LFDNSHTNWGGMISYYSFDFHLPYGIEYFFIYLAICVSSFENIYSDHLSIFNWISHESQLILLQRHNGEKTAFSISDAGKTRCPHAED
jgi:hypothetical protein